ncbi:MAG: respiratory nitrate reductase subunit gamma, partial [Deltaproteobacteria bacterium]|nr:respiratory nitrate reductase subunit gamma [Deltaproteobacteria bacterium]
AWAAGAIFIFGLIYRVMVIYRLAKKKDYMFLEYMDFKFGLRSILHWLTPFVPVNSQKHPFTTIVTFIFHICLLLVPIFLMAHVLLWEHYHEINLPSLPDHLADVMTVFVIGGGIFFAVRRATQNEVIFITTIKDWVILGLVLLPFVTGFLAYHQIASYQFMLILHILSGEIWLAVIPFTRLSHMIFFFWTRAYAGSEFGAVRHARDW